MLFSFNGKILKIETDYKFLLELLFGECIFTNNLAHWRVSCPIPAIISWREKLIRML